MDTIGSLPAQRRGPALAAGGGTGNPAFEWFFAGLTSWLVGGLYLDGWAHHRFPDLETFFTPWHGVLYAGFAMLAALFGARLGWSVVKERPLAEALPAGYGLSLLGILVFLAGGLGDMGWHLAFGIETSIDALLSPPHLLLASGGTLIVTGPLRAAWQRTSIGPTPGGWTLAPALISLALTIALFTFFTEYANPFFTPLAGSARRTDPDSVGQAMGVASILIQTAVLMSGLLLLLRRWALPVGSLTLILTITMILGVFPHGEYRFMPAALLTGLISDLLVRTLQPSAFRPRAIRLFACALPTILYSLYFATLIVTEGIWWSIHLWSGSIMLAGIVGWLLSYLAAPPGHPDVRSASHVEPGVMQG